MKLVFAAVVAIGVLTPSLSFAQAAPPAADVLTELLTEVRGLRQALERAATVGARIQWLVARVQMQEQRIAETSRRLVVVRDDISEVDSQLAAMLSQARYAEKEFTSAKPENRDKMQQMLESFKSMAAGLEKRKQELTNEEGLLLQQVASDQGRWSDVNAQLDDLERTLTVPAKK